VPRTFTPEQDAIILEGRKNNKTNAEIADQLGQGIKKGDVGTRFNALIKGSGDAEQGGVVKKGEGQWTGGGKSGGGNGGGGGEGGYYHPRMQYHPRAVMPLVPDKDFDEDDVSFENSISDGIVVRKKQTNVCQPNLTASLCVRYVAS